MRRARWAHAQILELGFAELEDAGELGGGGGDDGEAGELDQGEAFEGLVGFDLGDQSRGHGKSIGVR